MSACRKWLLDFLHADKTTLCPFNLKEKQTGRPEWKLESRAKGSKKDTLWQGLVTKQWEDNKTSNSWGSKNYLLNGGDIFNLQKILGHSSLASVRTYLSLFAVDLKKQHQRFSPVDNMADNKSLYPLLRASAKK